jgi:hypothetical protein
VSAPRMEQRTFFAACNYYSYLARRHDGLESD